MDSVKEEPILKLSQLSVQINAPDKDSNVVLDNVSFELFQSEILGIVGESGSGKSMTALSIIRLLPTKFASFLESSHISYCSPDSCIDILSLDESEMVNLRGRKIAMVFQEPMSSMNPTMRCGKQVLEAVELHQNLSKDEAVAHVKDLFQRVQLPDPDRVYRSYPHQLSGGQIQRIMIAMALAGKPDVLIADEPTTALDVTVQKEILELLLSIRDQYQTSIIFISHDLAVINQICNRVIVMKSGKVVEAGMTTQVFSSPKHPYTKGLIASRPPTGLKLKRLPTVANFLENPEMSYDDMIKDWKYSAAEIEKHSTRLAAAHPVLTVENLSKHFSSRTAGFFSKKQITKAVDDVSFKIRKGEILGLVGESGCGKSTISKLITKLMKPTSGSIAYEAMQLDQMRKEQLKEFRKKVQIIFQDPYSALNPKMKIGHAIKEPLDVHNIDTRSERRERVMQLLSDVGLEPSHYERYPHEFSGGQRQRIVIARALALSPELLICDESVSALDVSVQAKILNLLLELKEKHDMSYLFISHDLGVVQFLADRVMVMKSGKIVELGTSNEVYNTPKTEYTKHLIDAIPKF